MAFDLLSKLSSKHQSFSSGLLRAIQRRDDDRPSKIVNVPNLFEDQASRDSTYYQQCLERIYKYRESLYSDLQVIECDPKYSQFRDSLAETLGEAKTCLAKQSEHLSDCRQLGDINQHLLPQLISREEHLKLYKLLRSSIEANKKLKPLCDLVKREYKKLPIDTLSTHIATIRKCYFTFVSGLNVFIRAKTDPNSPFYRYMYVLSEEWKCILAELFEDIFVWSFDLVKWPIISLEDVHSSKTVDAKQMLLFRGIFSVLLELQTGNFHLNDSAIPENQLQQVDLFRQSDDGNLFHLPIKMMAVPLIKRFNYHFLSEQSKLNNIENPEWYLCQVEQWITRNEAFLSKTVDSILEEYFEGQCKSGKFQLTCHLLELVKAKLQNDADQLEDDRLFSLTLDEVIIFNKQVNYLVPGIFEFNGNLNPIRVFFDDDLHFQRFIQLEKNRLNEFVESIFESDSSWNVVYGADYTEDNKFIICEAADKFALLLQNLIERSTFIPLDKYRLRIVDLIIEIMDDFRLRLSQMVHVYEERWPFSKKFYAILNTFGFLLAFINEWQNNSYFLQILSDNDRDQTIFSSISKTFEHMVEEIFERIENVIIDDVTLDIIEYKKLNWHSMSINPEEMMHSKAGANLMYNLSLKNSTIMKCISSNLFHTFLYDIASKIQDLFFERLIMEHHFNRDGAQQLKYDIQGALFSNFSLYIKNTEYTFSKLSDALLILNFSASTCHDLRTRYKTDSELEFKQALRNIGIYSLKPATVMAVMEKRIGFN